ncbi:hypothetical protein ACFRJ9_21485 [Paenarthrobacter sp. NPDC056912]|uniref:hypothetical protein n=1 Tax=Paenarthrobacter sp. NPDC056912 TaxID=3345965 RepID=UPI00366BEA5C
MSSITKRRAKWVVAPVLALGLLTGGALAANAAANYTGEKGPNTIAPGATGVTGLGLSNQAAAEVNDTLTFTFQAPSNGTFADNQLGQEWFFNGSSQGLTWSSAGCVLSNGNKTLVCSNVPVKVKGNSGGNPGYNDIYVHIKADATAPYGTTFNNGTVNWTSANGTIPSTGPKAIGFRTPAQAATPMVDPVVGLGAAALVLGTGTAVAVNRRRRAGAVA